MLKAKSAPPVNIQLYRGTSSLVRFQGGTRVDSVCVKNLY